MYNDHIIIRSESEIKSTIKNIKAFNFLFSLANAFFFMIETCPEKSKTANFLFPAEKSVSLRGSQYYAHLTLLFYGVIHWWLNCAKILCCTTVLIVKGTVNDVFINWILWKCSWWVLLLQNLFVNKTQNHMNRSELFADIQQINERQEIHVFTNKLDRREFKK